jgi:hypothetical protein
MAGAAPFRRSLDPELKRAQGRGPKSPPRVVAGAGRGYNLPPATVSLLVIAGEFLFVRRFWFDAAGAARYVGARTIFGCALTSARFSLATPRGGLSILARPPTPHHLQH